MDSIFNSTFTYFQTKKHGTHMCSLSMRCDIHEFNIVSLVLAALLGNEVRPLQVVLLQMPFLSVDEVLIFGTGRIGVNPGYDPALILRRG